MTISRSPNDRVQSSNDRVQSPTTAFSRRTTSFSHRTTAFSRQRPRSVVNDRVQSSNDRVRPLTTVFGRRTTVFGRQTSSFGRQTTAFSHRPTSFSRRVAGAFHPQGRRKRLALLALAAVNAGTGTFRAPPAEADGLGIDSPRRMRPAIASSSASVASSKAPAVERQPARSRPS